jgi:hypothetical protein
MVDWVYGCDVMYPSESYMKLIIKQVHDTLSDIDCIWYIMALMKKVILNGSETMLMYNVNMYVLLF